MILFLVDALDEFVIVAFIALFVTQLIWPAIVDKPYFPIYRKWQARRKHRAPVVSILQSPERHDESDNTSKLDG